MNRVDEAHDRLTNIYERYGTSQVCWLIDQMKRMDPDDEEMFLSILYQDFDEIIRYFSERRPDFVGLNEDEISNQVKQALPMSKHCFIQVVREGGEQGHVDITITHGQKKYKWLGEAKFDRGPSYLEEGMKQLLTRYMSGNEIGGGMLIYNKEKDSLSRMKKWREHLKTTADLCYRTDHDDNSNKLAFISCHKHDATGLLIKTRHMYFSFLFDPKDKSARASKKNRN